MEKQATLAELTKKVSCKLQDSKNLLELLRDIACENKHIYPLITIIHQNIKTAFFEIEDCRKKIGIFD